MNKLPWILIGVGALLMLLTEGENLVIGWIAIIFLVLGFIPAYFQIKNNERQGLIKEINERLYKLGYTDNEVNERQPKLQSSTKSELKSIRRNTDFKIQQQKERAFFEPIEK